MDAETKQIAFKVEVKWYINAFHVVLKYEEEC